jgi:hypothetical protein
VPVGTNAIVTIAPLLRCKSGMLVVKSFPVAVGDVHTFASRCPTGEFFPGQSTPVVYVVDFAPGSLMLSAVNVKLG